MQAVASAVIALLSIVGALLVATIVVSVLALQSRDSKDSNKEKVPPHREHRRKEQHVLPDLAKKRAAPPAVVKEVELRIEPEIKQESETWIGNFDKRMREADGHTRSAIEERLKPYYVLDEDTCDFKEGDVAIVGNGPLSELQKSILNRAESAKIVHIGRCASFPDVSRADVVAFRCTHFFQVPKNCAKQALVFLYRDSKFDADTIKELMKSHEFEAIKYAKIGDVNYPSATHQPDARRGVWSTGAMVIQYYREAPRIHLFGFSFDFIGIHLPITEVSHFTSMLPPQRLLIHRAPKAAGGGDLDEHWRKQREVVANMVEEYRKETSYFPERESQGSVLFARS